jgi:hypothetical protein
VRNLRAREPPSTLPVYGGKRSSQSPRTRGRKPDCVTAFTAQGHCLTVYDGDGVLPSSGIASRGPISAAEGSGAAPTSDSLNPSWRA